MSSPGPVWCLLVEEEVPLSLIRAAVGPLPLEVGQAAGRFALRVSHAQAVGAARRVRDALWRAGWLPRVRLGPLEGQTPQLEPGLTWGGLLSATPRGWKPVPAGLAEEIQARRHTPGEQVLASPGWGSLLQHAEVARRLGARVHAVPPAARWEGQRRVPPPFSSLMGLLGDPPPVRTFAGLAACLRSELSVLGGGDLLWLYLEDEADLDPESRALLTEGDAAARVRRIRPATTSPHALEASDLVQQLVVLLGTEATVVSVGELLRGLGRPPAALKDAFDAGTLLELWDGTLVCAAPVAVGRPSEAVMLGLEQWAGTDPERRWWRRSDDQSASGAQALTRWAELGAWTRIPADAPLGLRLEKLQAEDPAGVRTLTSAAGAEAWELLASAWLHPMVAEPTRAYALLVRGGVQDSPLMDLCRGWVPEAPRAEDVAQVSALLANGRLPRARHTLRRCLQEWPRAWSGAELRLRIDELLCSLLLGQLDAARSSLAALRAQGQHRNLPSWRHADVALEPVLEVADPGGPRRDAPRRSVGGSLGRLQDAALARCALRDGRTTRIVELLEQVEAPAADDLPGLVACVWWACTLASRAEWHGQAARWRTALEQRASDHALAAVGLQLARGLTGLERGHRSSLEVLLDALDGATARGLVDEQAWCRMALSQHPALSAAMRQAYLELLQRRS